MINLTLRKNLSRNLTPAEVDTNFEKLLGVHGYAVYTDSFHTLENPFVIQNGDKLDIPNDALSVLNDQMLDDVEFYDAVTGKITPLVEGDEYTIRVSFKAFTTSNTGYAEITLDIGLDSPILTMGIQFPRGTGQTNVRPVSEYNKFFVGSTFMQNKGTLKIESVRGNTSIYDISYYITRTHAGS